MKTLPEFIILMIRQDLSYFYFADVDRYKLQSKAFDNGFDLFLRKHGGHIFDEGLQGLFLRISEIQACNKNFSSFHKLTELLFRPAFC